MLSKKFLKYALIIPALAGICVMASMPNISAQTKTRGSEDKVLLTQDEGKVVVDKTVHDFGTIKKENGKVSAVFTLTNKTDAPVLISGVKTSCGCTAPDWTKEPIVPKKTGTVTATFNAATIGPFDKAVTINVTEGDKTESIVVRIKGMVE